METTLSIIATIAAVISAIVAIVALLKSIKNEEANQQIAKEYQQITLSNNKISTFLTVCDHFQDIMQGLKDENTKKDYQQNYFDLCRDIFLLNKQGVLSEELWNALVERMRSIMKNDISFHTVWKTHGQIYNNDEFVYFMDNELFRYLGFV